MPLLAWIVAFSALGGIASAALAVVFLWIPERHAARILPHFVSFATGALLGAALLALLPEAIERAGVAAAHALGLTLIAGLGVFFVIEKLVLWWHTRGEEAPPGHNGNHPGAQGHDSHIGHSHARDHAFGVLVLVGDSVHNALDGVLIAAAFLTSLSLGLVTTFAVAAHEIPHRVGDFGILVHAGFSRSRALLLNLGTGIASVIGAVAAYYGLQQALWVLPYALAFAAAGFLYIAVAGLIPGLHRRVDPVSSAIQVFFITAGICVIALAESLGGV
ncbi:MAG TPA: ZIP family metal transporter [Steroidobacteraceae bacterium]|jgi:zinc and cadmium transporter|nr:ZIP family metal transporter [Steroidobacteraceae bacterium]